MFKNGYQNQIKPKSNTIFQQKLREKIESTFSQLDDVGDDTVFVDPTKQT